MQLSEITLGVVKQYLRIDFDDDDELITAIMSAVENRLVSMTGRTAEELNVIPDMFYPYMALCSQMYDVRDYTVAKDKLNPVAMQIIYSYAKNYL